MKVNSDISQVLNQIRQFQANQGPQAEGLGKPEVSAGSRFGDVMTQAIDKVNSAQQEAASLSAAFARGDANTELADVMLALNKSSVSFKAMAEVRNRLVSSYQDIMNMPV